MDKLYYNISNQKKHDFNSSVRKVIAKRYINNKNVYKYIKFSKAREKANALFGEMRNLTEEEMQEYRNILNKNFQKTGVNFFDLL